MAELWPQILFWLFGGIVIVSSMAVVATQNIVRCAAWLLLSLSATAGLFFLLGADFVGAVQLLIYVGGTLVLVIFGVMLTAQGPFVRLKPKSGEWVIAAVVGVVLLLLVYGIVSTTDWPTLETEVPDTATSPTAIQLALQFLGIPPQEVDGTPAIGDETRVGYLLPFEIVSVHLLVVLIGAAYLARAKRRTKA